jgi:hypothetical protein
MAEEDPRVMNRLAGLGIAALSVFLAAVVSAVRLRPYLESGATRTPPSFAIYPAGIAAAVMLLVVFALRVRRGGHAGLDIGPVTLTGNQPAVITWCLVYIASALLFFA